MPSGIGRCECASRVSAFLPHFEFLLAAGNLVRVSIPKDQYDQGPRHPSHMGEDTLGCRVGCSGVRLHLKIAIGSGRCTYDICNEGEGGGEHMFGYPIRVLK